MITTILIPADMGFTVAALVAGWRAVTFMEIGSIIVRYAELALLRQCAIRYCIVDYYYGNIPLFLRMIIFTALTLALVFIAAYLTFRVFPQRGYRQSAGKY